MTPKLSIIVPIYNVELYLRKCVDSLLAQDLSSTDYEIILVDDESPDGCPAICDEYARVSQELRVKSQECPSIKVIHRKNGGLSAARNSGIEVARGKYIMFVDSDDYLEPNVVGALVSQMESDQLDVLRYRLQYVNAEYQVFSPFVNPFRGNDYSKEPTDGVSFLNTRMNTQCYAWTFVVNRDLVIGNRCLFTEGIHFEDVDWTPRVLLKAKRVASFPMTVYNYLIREGSITQESDDIEKRQRNVKDALGVIERLNILIHRYPTCSWLLKMRSDLALSVLNTTVAYLYPQRIEYIERLRNLEAFPLTSPYPELSMKGKVWLYNLSPLCMLSIMHMLNKSHK